MYRKLSGRLTSVLLFLVIFLPGRVWADNKIDSLEYILQNSHDAYQKIELYTILSRQYQSVDQQKAKEFGMKALSLSSKTGVGDFLAEIYGCLGDVAVMQDSLDVAQKYYLNSLELFEESGDPAGLAGVSMVLGNIANVQDNLSEAMLYYQRAVKYAKEAGLNHWLDNLYHNIGDLIINAGSFVEAQEYLSFALEAAEKSNDSAVMASVLASFGDTYIELNDTLLARKYLQDARIIYQRINSYSGLSSTYLSLSKLEKAKKNYNKAIYFLELALEYLFKEDISYAGPKNVHLSGIYAELGMNYFELNEFEKSFNYFKDALNLGLSSGELLTVALAARGISDIWYRWNRYDSAYYYHKKYKKYSDSLSNEENIRKLAHQDARFRYEQLLAAESQKREEEVAQQRKNVLILAFIIIGLVLALVVLILLLKLGRNKVARMELQRKNLQNELGLRNKELTTHVMSQLKKNEFIMEVSAKLEKTLSVVKPENRIVIERVIKQLESDSSQEMWKEFELRFQNVHDDFFKKLVKKFPDLTANDLRLCAFLKLNLNTKEISSITHQSINSIDVARSRLRQKLGLDKEDNLIAFLAQY